MADRYFGIVTKLTARFGFLRTERDKMNLYFLSSQAKVNDGLRVGSRVSFVLGTNSRGPCAQDVQAVENEKSSERGRRAATTQQDYMAQAVIARDSSQFEYAERLYRKALDVSPSQQAFLSFAAMEKNRGRKKEAMEIYREGIKKFPAIKLYEDAATLAISLELHGEARELLTKALELSKDGTQGRIYLSLARNAFKENTHATLIESINYYERALKTMEAASISKYDLLNLNIARFRTQHHRGNLAFKFFNQDGFRILDVKFHPMATKGADLIVSIANKELIESFGIESKIFVTVFFKSQVTLDDIEALELKIQKATAVHNTDEQFCLIVTSSVPDELKKVLFGRIENKNKLYPAIVPIAQELLEGETPLVELNEVLGQWLYRRDLFNVNFPVVGRRFFGRNRDMDELRDAINDSLPVGLFGLRKVGKTSLLKELARRSGVGNDIYVYMDALGIPSDITDFKWVYWRLADELYRVAVANQKIPRIKWRLGGQYESFLDIPTNYPVATAFDADLITLMKAISGLSADARPRIVLLLDEIERLLPNAQGKEGLVGYFDFFSYIRGVSQGNQNFSLVVTGANAAVSEIAQFEGRDNPAFNFFKEVYLRLLPPQDCNAMLTALGRGMGVKFARGAIPKIVALTGGHPFFSRQFCSFLADKYKDRPLEVTEDMVKLVIDQYVPFCDKDMQEIFDRLSRDYPAERDFCVKLASTSNLRVSSRDAAEEVSGTGLRHLIGYQLIEISNDYVQFTMELLRFWLQRKIGAGRYA
ncbi:hypothetical protein ACCD08_27245 [Telluria sp. Tellsp104]